MRLRSLGLAVITSAIAAIAISGCASDATAPTAPAIAAPSAPSQSLLGSLLSQPVTVTPLLRNTPLPANVTASTIVGTLGGALSIPGAGLSIVIPPLAVAPGTRITVTALAGSKVAYEFQPHGIKFGLPLVATQNLRGTQAQSGGLISPLSLFAGYFPDQTRPTSITELLNVNVSLLNQTSIFSIWHFSGYIIATGRTSEGE